MGSLQIVPWGYVIGIVLPLVIGVHLMLLARFAHTLEPTEETPLPTSRGELDATYARATGRSVQLFALVVSVMFVALGVYLLIHNPQAPAAWLAIVFFGWGAVSAWRRLKTIRHGH